MEANCRLIGSGHLECYGQHFGHNCALWSIPDVVTEPNKMGPGTLLAKIEECLLQYTQQTDTS